MNHLLHINNLTILFVTHFNDLNQHMVNSIRYSLRIRLTIIGFDDGYFETIRKLFNGTYCRKVLI